MTTTIEIPYVEHVAEIQRQIAHPDNPVNLHYCLIPSERAALIELAASGATIMNQLGLRIGLSRAALTSLADRLERDGLLMRRVSETDRRVTYLTLTTEGQAAVDALLAFVPRS